MSLRSDLADVLRAQLPDYAVLDSVRPPDTATKPVVMVNRKTMTPADRHTVITHELEITVLVPESIGAGAEDAADDAVENVLRVIGRIDDPITWTKADRANFEGNFVGWVITLDLSTENYLIPEGA